MTNTQVGTNAAPRCRRASWTRAKTRIIGAAVGNIIAAIMVTPEGEEQWGRHPHGRATHGEVSHACLRKQHPPCRRGKPEEQQENEPPLPRERLDLEHRPRPG